ncbi:nucleoside-diphosphate-sugar epimerase [Elusimicrobium simillimum]|uniref:NAD-dependent epimerase/dehydratase family protein n=1 Tax=Elusimicrobium simillimum TaxID=3143438 RepID=UPI003C6FD9EA
MTDTAKTFAVTGGGGFIGGILTKALLDQGHSVRILSRTERKSANPKITYLKADYMDGDSLVKALDGCYGVYHLAAAIFAYNYSGFERANITTTKNLTEAAAKVPGLEFFVYMSSQAAGGYSVDYKNPRCEADAPAPSSDYGRTKLGGEEYVRALPANIKTIIFRAPIVYGKNDSGVSKIAAWVKRGVMVNTSKGDAYFNFIYVDDLVEALVRSVSLPGAYGQTFYVCEDRVYTWRYFIETMAAAMKVKKPFMFTAPLWVLKIVAFVYETLARFFGFAPALNYDKVREAAIPGHWVCSSKKWVTLTGQQFTTLEEGLKKSF